jgi:hypothetical protein
MSDEQEPAYMRERWRLEIVNENNTPGPDLAKEMETLGLIGVVKPYFQTATLKSESGVWLLPQMSPGFSRVLQHICDLHNENL